MAGFSTAIELTDAMTAPLMHILSALDLTVNSFENMESVANNTFDSSNFNEVRDELNQATIAAERFSGVLGSVVTPKIDVPNLKAPTQEQVKPTWSTSSNTEIFDSTGVDRLNKEMASLNSMSNEVLKSQQRISNEALNLEIIPENAVWDINLTSNRIEELGQKLMALQSQDITLLDDDSIVRLNCEFEGLRSNMNDIVNLQESMNQALSNGDISKLNSDYNKLNGIAEQVEKKVRDNIATINELNNFQWKSDNMEMFTNTGIDRFRQEIQSTNTILSNLNKTQQQISSQAAATDIFSDSAVADMNNVQSRIQRIISSIQQIEKNPLKIGTAEGNSQLEHLRQQLIQATTQQNQLNQAVRGMNVTEANQAYLKLSQSIGAAERYIRDNVEAQGQFNNAIRDGTNSTSALNGKLIGLAATYVTLRSAGQVLNISDTLTQTTARLNMMNDGLQSTKALQDMIYLSAERSRGSYQGSADAVSKMGIMAKDAFKSNTELIAFVEQLNKQFTIAGTSQEGISAATLQLTQAMGSGVLRGEELNSVFEQAPTIIQAIAKNLGVPIGQIRKLAEDGKLSAQVVKNALLATADETNAKFEKMPKTFSQIANSMKNEALMAFSPVLNRLNEIANSSGFQSMVSGITQGLVIVSGIVLEIFDLMTQLSSFITENWSILEPLIIGASVALGLYTAALIVNNIVQGISNVLKDIAAISSVAHGTATAAEAAATSTMTAAQLSFNAALLSCPLTWIILAIIAVITVIYLAVAAFNRFAGTSVSATGIIAGSIAAVGAFIWNTVIGVLNAIIQAVWSIFVEPFLGLIEWVLNAANGGFDSFGGAVANLIGQIISWFLSLGKIVTKIIDAIFGTDWTSGLSSLQDSVLSWGKTDAAITIDRDAPIIDSRLDYGDTFDAGYSFGKGVEDTISNFDPSSLFKSNIPNPNDYANLATVPGDISNIANNTGKIKDKVDISQEDLKYLRDLAETEVINRFTTAEIKVDMINHNNINNEMDLDGVINYLGEGLTEAMEKAAEGVHA